MLLLSEASISILKIIFRKVVCHFHFTDILYFLWLGKHENKEGIVRCLLAEFMIIVTLSRSPAIAAQLKNHTRKNLLQKTGKFIQKFLRKPISMFKYRLFIYLRGVRPTLVLAFGSDPWSSSNFTTCELTNILKVPGFNKQNPASYVG